jgi:hypothetical protein
MDRAFSRKWSFKFWDLFEGYGTTLLVRGSVVVKALCCKPEGRGLSPDEVDYLNLPNSSGRTIGLELTQPLTELSTRNLKNKETWGVKCGRRVGLTTLPPSISRLSK